MTPSPSQSPADDLALAAAAARDGCCDQQQEHDGADDAGSLHVGWPLLAAGVVAWLCVGIVAWFAVALWRAAPGLTLADWLALGCGTALAGLAVKAGAKAIATKRASR